MSEFFKFIDKVVNGDSKNKMIDLISCLKACQDLHRTGYWEAKKYGNHIMFAHLLENLDEELKELGEKAVLYFGDIDPVTIQKQSNVFMKGAMESDDNNERSLAIEVRLQKCIKDAYETMKKSKTLTLGIDEMFMNLANAHEDAMYHLKQSVKNSKKSD